MTSDHSSTGISNATMAVLMLSVFAISIGFGVVLPTLPFVIERLLGTAGDAAQVSRATGLLTGLYTLSLFLFASAWGRLSDQIGRRKVLVTGLLGFSATSLIFAFVQSLPAIYAERFLSGMFAAAVTPVALAAIGDLAATETVRARHLTFVSLAGISGFLLGPMLGLIVTRSVTSLFPNFADVGTLVIPLAGTAMLTLLVAIAVILTVSNKAVVNAIDLERKPHPDKAKSVVPRLLGLAFVVSLGVGVFEVGLALRGKQELGLTQYQVATMFTECSLVMLIVQAIVFSPWIRPESTRWLIAPAFTVLAVGLILVPQASDFALMLIVIGAVAASVGILSPILTYWISSTAGKAQGAELGKQTAAASLGAAVGSAVGGIAYNIAWLPNASFLIAGGLSVLAVLISVGLPGILSNARQLSMLGRATSKNSNAHRRRDDPKPLSP